MLLGNLYLKLLELNPSKTAIIFKENTWSYSEFDKSVKQTASALLHLGIKSGDRVALFMQNCVELVEFYLACFKIGAIAVPLNHRYMEDEVVYAADHCSACILIADEELFDKVKGIRSNVPSIKNVFAIGTISLDKDISWESSAAKAPIRNHWPEVKREEPALILYTSGSTNKPKGVTYTHASILSLCSSRKISQGLTENDISLAATAICHIGASAGVAFPTLYAGGTVVILEKPDPLLFLECVESYRPTRTILLPAQLIDVLDHSKAQEVDFGCFTEIASGGDYVSNDLYEHFRNVTGFELNQLYGLTECEGACFTPASVPVKRGSVGKPRDGVEIRLVNAEGEDVSTGESGEILIKSKSAMVGYWNDKENTSLAFKSGWLKTGDIGKRDEAGYFYYLGRIKEVIVKCGSNVAPGEVEEVLDNHPQILLSGVVGVPNKNYGELIHAFIELKSGLESPPGEQDLISYTSEKLAAYKVPDRWTFVERLPRNEIGKIDRRGLHASAVKFDAD